jgi:hypothetical protein
MNGGDMILDTYVNGDNEIESQGFTPFKQEGGNLMSLAVPAGLFILNHIYKPNKSLDNISVLEKKEDINEEDFSKFLKQDGFDKISITRKRGKKKTKQRKTRRKTTRTK